MKQFLPMVIAVGCLLASSCSHAQAALIVGAFDASRAGDANVITGIFSEDSIAALSANFPGTDYTSAPELTPKFLAGIDILVLTPASSQTTAITPLSVSEQSALLDFVKAGGSALLIGDGVYPFITVTQSFMAPLGVTFGDDFLTGPLYVESVAALHPVMNGPFGEVPAAIVYGSGQFTNLGPYATPLAEIAANQTPVFAAIERQALGPTSGRIVLIGDTTPFIDEDNGGFFGLQEHRSLFLNSINYLATPEPSSLVLLGIAGGVLGLIQGALRVKQGGRDCGGPDKANNGAV